MEKNKVLFMLPSIMLFILIAIYPVIKILIDVKKVESIYLSFGTIFYLLIFIIICILIIVEMIYLINYIVTKLEMNILKKFLWILLILVLNVLIIPYFYTKYIIKENKVLYKSLLYLIPIFFFIIIFIFGNNVCKTNINKINEERKRIEEERNDYTTKDNISTFTFRHGYKQSEVGEYDLYVQNKAKKVIFAAFTYDTDKYEQKAVDDYLNKGISDVSAGKEKFELFKEKEVIDSDDKTITTVEYVGKTKESSLCVYKISVISIKTKPNYYIYTVQIVTKSNYDLYIKEILEQLNSAKLK